jgi:hypothetical protein
MASQTTTAVFQSGGLTAAAAGSRRGVEFVLATTAIVPSTAACRKPSRRVLALIAHRLLAARPPGQGLAGLLEATPMNELRERSRRSLRPPTREAGQARKHGMRLLEPHVRDLAAVAGVPAKRSPPEPPRIVDQEQDELEGVGEADEFELRCRRQRHGRVV